MVDENAVILFSKKQQMVNFLTVLINRLQAYNTRVFGSGGYCWSVLSTVIPIWGQVLFFCCAIQKQSISMDCLPGTTDSERSQPERRETQRVAGHRPSQLQQHPLQQRHCPDEAQQPRHLHRLHQTHLSGEQLQPVQQRHNLLGQWLGET